MPRAAATPTRRPVKLPGPIVTAMRSSSTNSIPASLMTAAISGTRASAWPRAIGIDRLTSPSVRPVSSIAAEQASSAVSMAGTRNGSAAAPLPAPPPSPALLSPACGEELGRGRLSAGRAAVSSYRSNFDHVRNVVAQQVLNTVLQGCGRGWATGTRALHVEKHDAILEAPERNIAAVIGDGGPHTGLDQFLDDGDRLGVLGIEKFIGLGRPHRGADDRRAGHEVLHDRAENCRFDMLPLRIRFRHGDEVAAKKHAGHARNAEQPFRKGRLHCLCGTRNIEHSVR